jgi:hypothetical protein
MRRRHRLMTLREADLVVLLMQQYALGYVYGIIEDDMPIRHLPDAPLKHVSKTRSTRWVRRVSRQLRSAKPRRDGSLNVNHMVASQ